MNKSDRLQLRVNSSICDKIDSIVKKVRKQGVLVDRSKVARIILVRGLLDERELINCLLKGKN